MNEAEEIAYRAYPIDKDMPSVQQGSLVIARKQLALEIDEYAQQVSRDNEQKILTILQGAKVTYAGGHHEENTRSAFKHGIQTTINCVEAYIERGMKDTQNVANYLIGSNHQNKQ